MKIKSVKVKSIKNILQNYATPELEGVEFIFRARSDSPSISDTVFRVSFSVSEKNMKDIQSLFDKL